MKGLVGKIPQGMDGRKAQPDMELRAWFISTFNSVGASPFVAPARGTALVYAWGGGGSGGTSTGGGGGAAGFIPVHLAPGQTITWTVGAGGAGVSSTGNPGGDTTITLPDGRVCIARGGHRGAGTSNVAATASGFLLNRRGGVGGYADAGGAGEFGGAGGAYSAPYAGGGGAAGFNDKLGQQFWSSTALNGGDGATGGAVGIAAGSGGQSAGSGYGAAAGTGGVVLIFVRTLV